MVNGTHTQDKKEKNNSTYHHRFSFPFLVFFFLALGWPESAFSILFCFVAFSDPCIVYAQGKFKKSRVFQLGSRFVGQTPHSGDYREDFVTDQKFRVGRPGAAVRRTRIQILTEKCILRIPLSSDFLQIIGRKQIDGRIQKFGLEFKGLSAIESNSNLA